jgi:hypothetical protein
LIDVLTGLVRDYSQAIKLDEIVQQNIEVPCIFGDRSIILRSLENETGTLRLPLFILESNNIKTDTSRNADLHSDIFYQVDEAYSKLPTSDPRYRPYNLNKRRGLPITIDYTLTLIAKYKEDLDQMCTNWMVHWRPDIYVKWWHPRNKVSPLESEILWSQNISIDSNSEYEHTKRFQWKATTNFTFKTWVFPGLNSLDTLTEDAEAEKIIKYFNIYSMNKYEDFNRNSVKKILVMNGYPVFGDLYNRENAGFFVVDTDQGFKNDGSDPKGILAGKYMVNNVESNPSSILYDPVSGILKPGEPMIKDLTEIGDLPTNQALLQSFPKFHIWQNYLNPERIKNEQFGFRLTYFKNGFPQSSFLQADPSGDFLFQKFFSEYPRFIDYNKDPINNGYYSGVISAEFGINHTENLQPCYNYDIKKKELNVHRY